MMDYWHLNACLLLYCGQLSPRNNTEEATSRLVVTFAGSNTLADQKLVSFTDFPPGRSRMKWPSWSCVQKPAVTALAVQTYVLYSIENLRNDSKNGIFTNGQKIVVGVCDLSKVIGIPPFIYHHGHLTLRGRIEGDWKWPLL